MAFARFAVLSQKQTRQVHFESIRGYLGDADPTDPLASPLYGDLAHLPPIRAYVGDDEVLLDDSRRYVERAVAAGVDARIDVWKGMPHGFATGVGRMHDHVDHGMWVSQLLDTRSLIAGIAEHSDGFGASNDML